LAKIIAIDNKYVSPRKPASRKHADGRNQGERDQKRAASKLAGELAHGGSPA
jgi:hypothetical protein